MNVRGAEFATWLGACVLLVAPLLLSGYVTSVLVDRAEADRAQLRVRNVRLRADMVADQMKAAFDELERTSDPSPCSEARIAAMKRIDLSSGYIQAVGEVQGNRIICSSLVDSIDTDLGPPDIEQPTGLTVRSNVSMAFAPHAHFAIVQRDHYVAIIQRELALDLLETDQGFTLAIASLDGKVIVRRGDVPDRWIQTMIRQPGKTFVDDGRTIATSPSQRYLFSVLAAAPEGATARRRVAIGRVVLPASLALTALVLFVVARLARMQRTLRSAIRLGLKNNEFFLVYQPIVDLPTGRIVGAEALMRWNRGGNEVVRPDLFIPVAEQTGLIREITHRLVRVACEDFGGMLGRYPDFHLAFNLSTQDLADPKMVDVFLDAAKRMGATPGQIVLEATEYGFLDGTTAAEQVAVLRQAGMGVAIDDFGTGYSNLSRLEALQVDILKIDKAFVDTVGKGAATSHVILHIIQMAKSLGLQLVAEGVESEEQAEFLREHKVEFAQGWLFAKPMTAQKLLAELAARRP